MHIHFIQHVPFEYPGSILDWCTSHNHNYSIGKMFEGDAFPAAEGFDMLVIMGGPMGVYEESKYGWIAKEKTFIKSAIESGKKVLGICLGAQLVASVLGGNVYPHTLKEIGWWAVRKTTEHALTDQLPATFTCFHWHGDTYDLPEGAVRLLKTEGCSQQGFIYGNNVAGLQFHLEVKEDLLEGMTEHERAELVKSAFVQTEEEIITLTPHHIGLQKEYMHSLLDAFVKL